LVFGVCGARYRCAAITCTLNGNRFTVIVIYTLGLQIVGFAMRQLVLSAKLPYSCHCWAYKTLWSGL